MKIEYYQSVTIRHGQEPSLYGLPEWAIKWKNPWRTEGGRSINLATLYRPFFPPFPEKGSCTFTPAFKILAMLEETKLIRHCLNLDDGNVIVKDDGNILTVNNVLPSGKLFLWQTVAVDIAGNEFVPYLQIISNQVPIIYWWWLEYGIDMEKCLGFVRS